MNDFHAEYILCFFIVLLPMLIACARGGYLTDGIKMALLIIGILTIIMVLLSFPLLLEIIVWGVIIIFFIFLFNM